MKKVRILIVSASVASLLLTSTAGVVEANKKICPRINPNFCYPTPKPLIGEPIIYPIVPRD